MSVGFNGPDRCLGGCDMARDLSLPVGKKTGRSSAAGGSTAKGWQGKYCPRARSAQGKGVDRYDVSNVVIWGCATRRRSSATSFAKILDT